MSVALFLLTFFAAYGLAGYGTRWLARRVENDDADNPIYIALWWCYLIFDFPDDRRALQQRRRADAAVKEAQRLQTLIQWEPADDIERWLKHHLLDDVSFADFAEQALRDRERAVRLKALHPTLPTGFSPRAAENLFTELLKEKGRLT